MPVATLKEGSRIIGISGRSRTDKQHECAKLVITLMQAIVKGAHKCRTMEQRNHWGQMLEVYLDKAGKKVGFRKVIAALGTLYTVTLPLRRDVTMGKERRENEAGNLQDEGPKTPHGVDVFLCG
jgi:hypothetical protein